MNNSDNVELPDGHAHATSRREDANMFRSMGLDVDDDNDPAPENMSEQQPSPSTQPASSTTSTNSDLKEGQSWGWNGIYPRSERFMIMPQINALSGDVMNFMTIVQFFLLFFGWPIINLVIKCANANLPEEKQMDRGEFLRFIGTWLLASTIGGAFDKKEHWSTTMPLPEQGAPCRFNEWMRKNRFRDIMSTLRHNDDAAPACRDKFHGMRKTMRL